MRQSIAMARRLPARYERFTLDGVTPDSSFNRVREYAKRVDHYRKQGMGLLLMGPNGAGKSGALAALHNLAKTIPQLNSVKYAMWCYARDIARTYEYGLIDETFDEYVDDLYEEARWLVVDELGRESDIKNHDRRMHALLRKRADNGLVTHFSTNLRLDEIDKVYGRAFASLLHETCILVTVD